MKQVTVLTLHAAVTFVNSLDPHMALEVQEGCPFGDECGRLFARCVVCTTGWRRTSHLQSTGRACAESRTPQVLHLADEKVNLAGKVYDYVDQRIRRLDRDLAAFDEELARERAKLGVVVRTPAFVCPALLCVYSCTTKLWTCDMLQ